MSVVVDFEHYSSGAAGPGYRPLPGAGHWGVVQGQPTRLIFSGNRVKERPLTQGKAGAGEKSVINAGPHGARMGWGVVLMIVVCISKSGVDSLKTRGEGGQVFWRGSWGCRV